MKERTKSSEDGVVYSLARTILRKDKGAVEKPERILRQTFHNGYPRIRIKTRCGAYKTVYIHTLVLTAFVGPRPPGMHCRHLDGNKKTPHLLNLKWGTPKENGEDKLRHGTSTAGERDANSKLTDEQVLAMRREYKNEVRIYLIARKYGVSFETARRVCMGRSWKHLPVEPLGHAYVRCVGVRNPKAKLTDEQVLRIREMKNNGVRTKDLSLQFGVGKDAIADIITGRRWKHLLPKVNPNN